MRYPVSFAQRRLWFLEQLMPGEPTFHMPYAIWLEGRLDTDALQRAMDCLVARHPVLRTSIMAVDGVPEQVVADDGTVPIERLPLPDAADLAADEARRRAGAIATERAVQPFDLARGPLLRALLIDAGADRWLLSLVMHHIISDGLSMQILIDELSALYRAELTGEPVSLPRLWMNYGDYAVWQQDRLRGEELERQLQYWRDQLRGAPAVLSLPTDRPRPAKQSSRGGVAAVLAGRRHRRPAGRAGRGRQRHHVHGVPDRVRRAAVEVLPAARPGGRHPGQRPDACRAGPAGRHVHQHRGAAHLAGRRPGVRRAGRPGSATPRSRRCRTRSCRSRSWSRSSRRSARWRTRR